MFQAKNNDLMTDQNGVTVSSELVSKAQWMYRQLMNAYGQPEWHNPLPPLDELVSTILSQNTNDRNRDLAFNRLRVSFNTWEEVRDSDVQNVIAAIRVAGLANKKAPRIQSILRRISTERGNLDIEFLRHLPPEQTRKWLLDLNGVGPKTAAIVMQFSLGMPAFPVDTHIYRVTGRFGLRPKEMTVEKAHLYLAKLFSSQDYYAAHLNLIRHGREICLARHPHCSTCVLRIQCIYNQV